MGGAGWLVSPSCLGAFGIGNARASSFPRCRQPRRCPCPTSIRAAPPSQVRPHQERQVCVRSCLWHVWRPVRSLRRRLHQQGRQAASRSSAPPARAPSPTPTSIRRPASINCLARHPQHLRAAVARRGALSAILLHACMRPPPCRRNGFASHSMPGPFWLATESHTCTAAVSAMPRNALGDVLIDHGTPFLAARPRPLITTER